MANSTIHTLGVDKWVVSWTQAFAMHICVVAPTVECLRVKADMVLFAGNTVWSISEHVRCVCKDALYKLTLPYHYQVKFQHGKHIQSLHGKRWSPDTTGTQQSSKHRKLRTEVSSTSQRLCRRLSVVKPWIWNVSMYSDRCSVLSHDRIESNCFAVSSHRQHTLLSTVLSSLTSAEGCSGACSCRRSYWIVAKIHNTDKT